MYTHKGITYRTGTVKDIPGLLFFINNFRTENKLVENFGYDMAKSADVLKRLLSGNRGVILLALDVDIIVGTIILGKTVLWWAERELFSDLVFYVNPEYRKGRDIQAKLLDFSKDFANSTGKPVVIDIFNDSENNERMTKYLGFKGFKNIGFKSMFTPQKE